MYIKGTDLQGILKYLFSLNYFTKIEKGKKGKEGRRERGGQDGEEISPILVKK